MNKVKEAITCVDCYEIIESPVLLPCSHSICEKHVRADSNESFKCGGCGVEHEVPTKTGFPKNQALEYILEAKISSLDFGQNHIKAKENCVKVKSLLKGLECLANEPSTYISEEIGQLRNRVYIKSEQLKLSVDQMTNQTLDKLKEYQKKCDDLLINNKKLTPNEQKKLNVLQNEVETKLASWQLELNEVKFNENRWISIGRESEEMIKYLEGSIDLLKQVILLSPTQHDPYHYAVSFFENNQVAYYQD